MTDSFVSPEWVADNRDDAVLVDVRRPWEYEDGHVPDAVNLPFDDVRDPTDDAPGKLPAAEDFGAALGDAGVSPDDQIIAYDGDFGVYAARFLVTAEVYGHDADRLHVLDGGYDAWREGRPTSAEVPAVEPRPYEPQRIDDGPLISAPELEEALDSEAVIVDTRDPLEYDAVHVPGAVNVQWRDLVDEDALRLEPRDRCRELLAEAGVSLDRPVRLYCNTARRLSFVYAVLRDLGHDDVAFYEGGIDAWADYGGAVETST